MRQYLKCNSIRFLNIDIVDYLWHDLLTAHIPTYPEDKSTCSRSPCNLWLKSIQQVQLLTVELHNNQAILARNLVFSQPQWFWHTPSAHMLVSLLQYTLKKLPISLSYYEKKTVIFMQSYYRFIIVTLYGSNCKNNLDTITVWNRGVTVLVMHMSDSVSTSRSALVLLTRECSTSKATIPILQQKLTHS